MMIISQYVVSDGHHPTTLHIILRVLPGLILGLLLFIIYLSYLCKMFYVF